MTLAPIILFIYKRPAHTLKVLEALQNNVLASQSALYIYCDGPKKNADSKTLKDIVQTREIARSKKWCKQITIIEREENYGLERSIIEGITEIINKHEKTIVLEDDIVPSKYFLQFMNDALNIYEDEKKVLSIGALNFFAVDDTVNDTFFVPIPDCWGWATWKDRWLLYEPNAQKLFNKLNKKGLLNKFNLYGAYNFEKMLIDQIKGNISSWAIRWQAVAYLEDKLTLYPRYAVTKNIGFDNRATHGGEDKYSKNIRFAEKRILVEKIAVAEQPAIIKKMIAGYFKAAQPNRLSKIKPAIIKFIKYIVPPIIVALYRWIKPYPINSLIWQGDFSSWNEAKKNCTGYEDLFILEKTKNAILKVKKGLAAGERDSVLFEEIQYTWPLTAYLLKFAIENNNQLNIIDFGGSLGSSYFQNKNMIPENIVLSWNVVEQEQYIVEGNKIIADNNLHFFNTINEAHQKTGADIILLSSVLQYIESPYSLLDEVMTYKFKYIIIDRTAFIDEDKDRITTQHVPPSIYKASYPAWFFNNERFKNYFSSHYEILSEFKNDFELSGMLDDKTPFYWRGYILKRRS